VGHVDRRELAMLSPQQIAAINVQIEKLEYARKQCSDSGIQKVIEGWINGEKMKLNSDNNLNSQNPSNQAHSFQAFGVERKIPNSPVCSGPFGEEVSDSNRGISVKKIPSFSLPVCSFLLTLGFPR
jgi:hypothetical protein